MVLSARRLLAAAVLPLLAAGNTTRLSRPAAALEGPAGGQFSLSSYLPSVNNFMHYGGLYGGVRAGYTISACAGPAAGKAIRLAPPPPPPRNALGCTDPSDARYNPRATVDDGSCAAASGKQAGACTAQIRAAKKLRGAVKPQCDDNGGFMPVQCGTATRGSSCWCVDTAGAEIASHGAMSVPHIQTDMVTPEECLARRVDDLMAKATTCQTCIAAGGSWQDLGKFNHGVSGIGGGYGGGIHTGGRRLQFRPNVRNPMRPMSCAMDCAVQDVPCSTPRGGCPTPFDPTTAGPCAAEMHELSGPPVGD
jgi:hypothetical protein